MKNNKNVLFVSELSNLGGGETSLLNLITEFNSPIQEVNPILMCFDEGKLSEESRAEGIQTIIYNFKEDIKKFQVIRGILNLKEIIQRNKIDVIQTNEWTTAVMFGLACKICSIKSDVIWICHGQWYQFNFIKKNLVNLLIDNIISVSNAVNDNLIKNGINPKKITKIPLGIDISKFSGFNRNNIRQEMNLSENEKIFATIGRFQEIKGQKLLIDAAKELKESGKKFKVLIVGDSIFNNEKDDQYKRECLNLIQEYGLEDYFLFLGVRRDIGNILSGIDSLIVPSINESFGMVVIEAFAAGCPVISTPCDGPKEIIENGISGIILPERSTECLKNSMEDVLDDKVNLKEISNNQRKYANNYSIKNVCSMYNKLYNSLCNN